jgi:short subunit dehydrogenase-like uncharacterized protein
VAEELLRLKCPVRFAARSKEKLDSLKQCFSTLYHQVDQKAEYVVVDLTSAESLDSAMKECSVVINCAGPFLEWGEPVVDAAVRSGAHYLDTTGEQQFIKLVYDKYGESARQKGLALIPACAFEYAIGDAAAALLDANGKMEWKDIEILYWIQGFHTSRGTQKSILQVLGRAPLGFESGKTIELAGVEFYRDKDLPGPGTVNAFTFPAGEILFLPLHMNVHSIKTLLTSTLPPFGMTLLHKLAKLTTIPVVRKALVGHIDKLPIGPAEHLRASSIFTIVCRGNCPMGSKSVVVKGSDPYLLTAMIAAGVAKKLYFGPASSTGPTSPAMVAGAEFIQQLTTPYAEWSAEMS